MITIVFYILAAITLGSGLLTVLSKHPIHSAIYMVVCFFSVAGHFLLLNAQFLAMVQAIVYAGAIMVLILFTLMLMNLDKLTVPHKKIASRIAAITSSCLAAFVLLAALVKANPLIESYKTANVDFQSTKVIGEVLLNEYLVPFEFASVLLLVSMVGAVLISKREKKA